MNEQTQPIPPPPTSTSSIDVASVVSRAIAMLTNPKGTWPEIKAEGKSVADIYLQYLVILAVLKPVSQFVQGTIVGTTNPITGEVIRVGFISGIIFAIVGYFVFLALTYVASLVIQKLAPKFDGNCSQADGLALVGYASTAALVGAGLGIIPLGIFAFVGALVSLYSIYLFYIGIETMTGVPAAKKLPFFAVYVLAMVLVFIAIGIVSMVFGIGFIGMH